MRAATVFFVLALTAAASAWDASVYHDPKFVAGETYEAMRPGEERTPPDLGGTVSVWIPVGPAPGDASNFLSRGVEVSIVGSANGQTRWRHFGNAIIYNTSCENAPVAEVHPGVRSNVSSFRLDRPSPVRGVYHRDLCRVYCGRHTRPYYCSGVVPTAATDACRCDDEPTYHPNCSNVPFLTARLQTTRLYTAWVTNDTGPVAIRGSEAKNMTVGWQTRPEMVGHVACWTVIGVYPGERINGTSIIRPLLPPPPPPSPPPPPRPPCPPCRVYEKCFVAPVCQLSYFQTRIIFMCVVSFAAGVTLIGLIILAMACGKIYCETLRAWARGRGQACARACRGRYAPPGC